MAKSARPTPSLLPAVLALLVLLVVGYLLFTDSRPSRTEHTLSPPIDIAEIEEETLPEQTPVQPLDQHALVQEEAELFVDKLGSDSKNEAVTITENKGGFVRHDGHITLPFLEHRSTTIASLLQDDSLDADTPITLNFTEKESRATTLAELSQQTEDKTASVHIQTSSGQDIEAPLADLLANPDLDQQAPITLFIPHHRIEQTTKAELAQSGIAPTQKVIATLNHGSEDLSVKDIIQSDELPDNALFYLHRVTEQDKQGLWGIVQTGLIERFREGLILEGISLNKDKVQVTIPADADEPLPTGLSSFLGKILNDKVETSYIYNFSTRTMGHDPNLIHPGQQLILIHFSPQELKTIYLFFAEQRQQQAQSFAITQ